MKITILGLGYVGTVTAACLAREGHEVTGVDVEPAKVDAINAGEAPVIERDLAPMIRAQVVAGRLRATSDAIAAILRSDLFLVCVGTPGRANGDIDLGYVRRVSEQIGAALRYHPGAPVVVFRSTLVPGTMRNLVIPTLERRSGRRAGVDFGVCLNPEFLREGSAVHDFFHPPKTVIGEFNRASGDLLASLFSNLAAPLARIDIDTAEMVKYADNAWHALKVGFANEIGALCKALDVDSHRVMELFCRDTKLNLSPAYLRPGFAFGGSCLPKDLRALLYKAKTLDVALPILGAVLPSNERQLERGVQAVIDQGSRRVGLLGLSFKAGTDDLRESPMVELSERLIGKGYDLRIYDGNVHLAALHGANREFILQRVPHIARLLVASVEEVLAHASTVVIGNSSPEFRDVPKRLTDGQRLIDLVRITDSRSVAGVYEGIGW
ncbi:MAG TPA: nucleotide sugar dehydrogenase [Burkholderiales bacterium]